MTEHKTEHKKPEHKKPVKKEVTGKKPLPPVVYLVIGAAMVLMSVFIDAEKLLLFILVGAVFIVIGFIKTVMNAGEEKHKKRRHHRKHLHHAAHGQTHKLSPKDYKQGEHPTHEIKKTKHGTHMTAARCASCGVKLHPQFKYCPNCGQKLK